MENDWNRVVGKRWKARRRGKKSLNRKEPFEPRRWEEIICWFSDFFPREWSCRDFNYVAFSLCRRGLEGGTTTDNIRAVSESFDLTTYLCQLFVSDEPRHHVLRGNLASLNFRLIRRLAFCRSIITLYINYNSVRLIDIIKLESLYFGQEIIIEQLIVLRSLLFIPRINHFSIT